MIGLHGATLYPSWPSTATSIDLSVQVESVSIHHGRDDAGGQPEASSATVDLLVRPDLPLPVELDVGAVVAFTTKTATQTSTRFVGRVTDVVLGWDEAGDDTPDTGVGQVTCIGLLADLGRRVVGDVPWPTELDGARVSRVMTAAGMPLNPATSDPGIANILARDVDSQPALDVAHSAAESARGILWATRGGEVRYADSEHRRGLPSSLTLDACNLLVTPTWRRSTDGLVNEVSIGYGVAASGGDQPRYYASNQASVDKRGRYGYSATTELANLADAQALGGILLARNASPVWIMAALPVDVKNLTDAEYDALLGLDMHSLLTLTGLPAIGTAPTSAALWVEGWKESLRWGEHDVELCVTGYCRTVPAPRWDDVDPGWLWGGMSWTEQRRNVIPNPNFERDVAGWSAYAGVAAPVQDSTSPYSGGYRLRADGNGGSTAPRVQLALTGMVAGDVWTLSARLRHDGTWPGGGTSYAALRYQLAPSSEQVIAATPAFVADGAGYMRVSVTGTVPATTNGTVVLNLGFAGLASALTAAGSIGVDEVMMTKGAAVGAYFDGDTPDYSGADYEWTGVPGASASTQTGYKELRRNLSRSPRAVVGGWLSNDGASFTVALNQPISDHPQGITTAAKATRLGSASAPTQLVSAYDVDGLGNTGTPRVLGLWVKSPVAANASCYLGGDVGGTSKVTPVPANVWTWVTTSPTTPGTGYSVVTVIAASGNAAVGAVTLLTGSDSESSVPPSFFDGATPDAPGVDYAWTGTANVSASVQSEVVTTPGGLSPTLTWDDAACLGPPVNLGRWNDQPASLRWNQVPAGTVWNNYGG